MRRYVEIQIKTFWDIYDNLGRGIILNIFWFLPVGIFIIPGFFMFVYKINLAISLLLMSIGLILIPAATGTMYKITRTWGDEDEIPAVKFFALYKESFVPYFLLGLVYLLGEAILIGNIWFYMTILEWKKLGLFMAGMSFWILFFWNMMAVYFFALNALKNIGILSTLKKSALLALDNKIITVLVLIQKTAVLVFSVVSMVPLLIIGPVMNGFLGNSAMVMVLEKYEILERKMRRKESNAKPTSWKEIREMEEEEKTIFDRYRGRGWKDILRPWEM